MKVIHAALSANRISDCTLVMGGALCGVLGFSLVLPLALSSPYPTLKPGRLGCSTGIKPTGFDAVSVNPTGSV